jgi:hypothetical protein
MLYASISRAPTAVVAHPLPAKNNNLSRKGAEFAKSNGSFSWRALRLCELLQLDSGAW